MSASHELAANNSSRSSSLSSSLNDEGEDTRSIDEVVLQCTRNVASEFEKVLKQVKKEKEQLIKDHRAFQTECEVKRREIEAERLAWEDYRREQEWTVRHIQSKARDYINLNVGGEKFVVPKEVLMASTDSFFYAMLRSGCFLPDKDTGEYFIDRDPTHFQKILDYLRSLHEWKCRCDEMASDQAKLKMKEEDNEHSEKEDNKKPPKPSFRYGTDDPDVINDIANEIEFYQVIEGEPLAKLAEKKFTELSKAQGKCCWRIRLVGGIDQFKCWTVHLCRMYDSLEPDSPNLCTEPTRAFSSSNFSINFLPSFAFDPDTREWGTIRNPILGNEWLGYVFPEPVNICAIDLNSFITGTDDIATELEVESADTVDGEWTRRWTIHNPNKLPVFRAVSNLEEAPSSTSTSTTTATTTTTTITATDPTVTPTTTTNTNKLFWESVISQNMFSFL